MSHFDRMKGTLKNMKPDYQTSDHTLRLMGMNMNSALSGVIRATIWRGIDIKRLRCTKKKDVEMKGIKVNGKLYANSKDMQTELESTYNIEDLEQKEDLLWWQKRGLSYTSNGYGRKIPTSTMVKIPGLRNIWRRVYCCVYSNIGTCYVTHGRNWIVIR